MRTALTASPRQGVSASGAADRWGRVAARVGLYALAVGLAGLFMAPFTFAALSSLKQPTELYALPPIIVPARPQLENYLAVWSYQGLPFGTFYWNTVLIASSATLGNLIAASLSAFGFARFRWRGRDLLFMVLLSTLVLPEEVVIIPKFLMFNNVPQMLFGQTLIDTWWPLILPAWIGGGAFNVFLLRQFFMQIPRDLDDAAVIDGAGYGQILFRVILPLAKPAVATVAIFSFLGHWNDFLLPLIYLHSKEHFTLAIGLNLFRA
jgi:multiple sugar transport system permease protein